MSKIGIFYASAGGTTKIIVDKLATHFDVDDDDIIFMEEDYDDLEQFDEYDILFIGSSTWGQGDPHFEWVDPILEITEDADFSGKKVAFFGAGDSIKHGEHFCSALGKLYDAFVGAGATPVASIPVENYTFKASLAVKDGKFCGLAIDQHNEADKTEIRIDNWLKILDNIIT